MTRGALLATFGIAAAIFALPALGASPGAPAVDGRHLNLLWAVPFIGILLSIAIMPLAAQASGITTSARSLPDGRYWSLCPSP